RVAVDVLAVRGLPVPPGREERRSGVRGPDQAPPPDGPGGRPAPDHRLAPRDASHRCARAERGPARGYAVIYARLATVVESPIFGQTGMGSRRLGAQEPAEVRHGERDQAALGAVDQ